MSISLGFFGLQYNYKIKFLILKKLQRKRIPILVKSKNIRLNQRQCWCALLVK